MKSQLPRASTSAPDVFHARVDPQGRVLIPAELRKELELAFGDRVTLRIKDGELRLITVTQAIRRAQQIAQDVTGGRTGLVDEFIANRRREWGEE